MPGSKQRMMVKLLCAGRRLAQQEGEAVHFRSLFLLSLHQRHQVSTSSSFHVESGNQDIACFLVRVRVHLKCFFNAWCRSQVCL